VSVDVTKKQLLKAIQNSGGIINNIAKRLNIAWHTCNKNIKKHPEAIQAVENEKEKNLDKAENVIMDAIDEKDIQTSKWYLQTIGKNRGYTEKHQVDVEFKGIFNKKIQEIADNIDNE
jgi:hypothetical protein